MNTTGAALQFQLKMGLTPPIYIIQKKLKSYNYYLCAIILALFLYELFRHFSLPFVQDGTGKLASLFIHDLVAYSILFALGLPILSLTRTTLTSLSVFYLLLFASFALFFGYTSGRFVPTQDFKYPPSIYYFSYAIAVSMFLWLISPFSQTILESRKHVNTLVMFIAHNSIWVYLWHIPGMKFLHTHFLIKYVIAFSLAVFVTFIQVWVVENVLVNLSNSGRFKRNIRTLLTG